MESDFFLVHYDGDFEILRVEPIGDEHPHEATARRIRESGLYRRFDSSVGELFQIEVSDRYSLDGKLDISMMRIVLEEERDE